MAINYTVAPEWHQKVLRPTNGESVNVVLEVGGLRTINRSVAAPCVGGSIVFPGGVSGFGGAVFLDRLLTGAKRMVGFLSVAGPYSNSEFVLFTEPD